MNRRVADQQSGGHRGEIDDSSSDWKTSRDGERDERFAAEGIATLHIPARRIFENLKRVVEEIAGVVLSRNAIKQPPRPITRPRFSGVEKRYETLGKVTGSRACLSDTTLV